MSKSSRSISNRPRSCAQRQERPVVCITMGYPSGIGAEIILKALARPNTKRLADFLIIGDEFVFKKASSLVGKRLRYKTIKTRQEIDFSKERILFLDLENVPHNKFGFGIISGLYGKASIDYIKEAVSIIKQKRSDILVTAPIHKYAAELSGFKYSGHTEYLAHLSGIRDYAMMFIGGPLKVVLATIHLPLRNVALRLKKKKIIDILELTDYSLKRYFRLRKPSIAICGLNPHAGEGGSLGNEEINIIAPAVKSARRKGIGVCGPYAADALFYDLYKGDYDAVICMYHDQGLVALKMLRRHESVNITLGLPFIRTSPGHGTALDIVKKGIASSNSMKEAIKTAVAMFRNKR